MLAFPDDHEDLDDQEQDGSGSSASITGADFIMKSPDVNRVIETLESAGAFESHNCNRSLIMPCAGVCVVYP